MIFGCSVLCSSNVIRACLRKFELDLNGLNYNAAKIAIALDPAASEGRDQ
jgi:hypothetical protein